MGGVVVFGGRVFVWTNVAVDQMCTVGVNGYVATLE